MVGVMENSNVTSKLSEEQRFSLTTAGRQRQADEQTLSQDDVTQQRMLNLEGGMEDSNVTSELSEEQRMSHTIEEADSARLCEELRQ
jgi:hypothetical protein